MRKVILTAFMMTAVAVSFAQTTDKKVTTKSTTSTKAGQTMSATTAAVSTDASMDQNIAIKENISVSELEHDFAKIPQGTPVTTEFVIKNTSKAAYKLTNVQASCGCTTPVWDREQTIEPGKTAVITVGYNAAAPGPFTKPVTITYGDDNQTKVIYIKGEVWAASTDSAPVNEAVKQIQ